VNFRKWKSSSGGLPPHPAFKTFQEQETMSYREVSEIPDGMQIDWDMPITMDDGLVLRCDIYRPIRKGALPRHPQQRPLRQVAALRGRLQDRLDAHGGKASERDRGVD